MGLTHGLPMRKPIDMSKANATKTIDTMTRKASGIRCELLQTTKGFVVKSRIGSVHRTTEPMSREVAATLWEGLQRVGMPR